MLTADLVHARRRGDSLQLVRLDDEGRARATELAKTLLALVADHVGRVRDELDAAIDALPVSARDERLKAGLVKLVLDRCELDASDAFDPPALRRALFERAAAVRRAGEGHLDAAAVTKEVAHEQGLTKEALESALYADLRGAHELRSLDPITAEALVASYDRAQAQAVLLRAVRVLAEVRCASPGATRALFHRLKFLRLLHTIEPLDDGRGHRIVIDGPFSLFESVTKYGLQLAMVLPALEGCDAWKLEADVRWGKERLPLKFRLEGGLATRDDEAPRLPDEVAALVRAFESGSSPWKVKPSDAILTLPGVGLCVPDLVFERRGDEAKKVYLEVMGYWSRDAVWKRIELVQAGLAAPIVFAVSKRLRVSEEVLDEDASGALYVYAQVMSARAIEAKLEAVAGAGNKQSPRGASLPSPK